MKTIDLPLQDPSELTVERLRQASSIRTPNTLACYASDWRIFRGFCERCDRKPLPANPDTIALYITDLLKTHKISTAVRHLAAIRFHHVETGLDTPVDASVWSLIAGAKRLRCETLTQRAPITVEQLRQMVQKQSPDTEQQARNRAILLLGFSTALRRSNLCALDLADLEFADRGLVVRVRREKQDQLGKGRLIGVPFGKNETCPVTAVREWLAWRGKHPGPLFPGGHQGRLDTDTIANVVKRAAKKLGLDPQRYGGHSLRAGFVTEAVERGVNEFTIAATTGHRSLHVLRRYFRRTDPFRACAFASFGM